MKYLLVISLLIFSNIALSDVSQDVVIEKPYVRAAIIQQRNSAIYMRITNQGDPSAIVSAKSSVAVIVELHTHINDNGVMRMRKIEQIDLPTNERVYFQPGGLHIMLLGLKRDLKPGESIDVTLGFADGSEKAIMVPVQTRSMKKKLDMEKHKVNGVLPKKLNQ